MQWQDIVIAIGGWAATFALIPTLLAKEKPALSSSVLTVVILSSFTVCYVTLGMWNASVSTAALTIAWLVLAWQKWRRAKIVIQTDDKM